MAISYTKTNWQDAPSTATPITAAQLNRMEKGIDDCKGLSNANELAIAANAEAIQNLQSNIPFTTPTGEIDLTQLLLLAHPIGSIYITTSSTSPAKTFGGTWKRISGRFIWGAEDDSEVTYEDGERTHTLTENELPKITGDLYNFAIQDSSGVGVSGHFTQVGGSMYATYGTNGSTSNVSDRVTYAFGNNQPHENMPPWYGAYIWRRTA